MKREFTEERVFMNTSIVFRVFTTADKYDVYDQFETGFRQFDYVVREFSRFDEKSELSSLNRSQNKKFNASKELYSLVSKALAIAHETNGAYDPTIIDILELYGYDKHYDFSVLKDKELVTKKLNQLIEKRPSFKEIQLDDNKRTILMASSQRIDLGSIGKGYAIDLAFEKLKPLENVLINAGGDIRVLGLNSKNSPWEVALDVPGKRSLGEVHLTNGSVASSGSWARQVEYFHHLINTKTGKPVNKSIITFTHATLAVDADVWSTVLFVMGRNSLPLLQKHSIDGLLIDEKGEICSQGFNIIR